ncbi:hypothetical protein SAMN05216267_105535 [Actinacidiphila rubida]|uniref:Uncharacterized protein n=1 Tax=Actinacidiphila rubida TaxID=310780 RepID=A0A1H8TMP7_9ACTN|nr:hypothetical protein SAMN05216267_105535 [Actinacidiphila rubida]
MIARQYAPWTGPLALAASATAVAAMVFAALRVSVDNAGPGHIGKAVVVLVLGGFGGAVAFAATFLAMHVAVTVRAVARRHPRTTWWVGQAAGAAVLLLAAAVAVTRGWSGEAAGAAAGTVVAVICASAAGTVAAVLLLGWTLSGPHVRVMRPVVAAVSVFLAATCFLTFRHLAPGGTLAGVAVAVAFVWTAMARGTPAAPEVILGFGLLFALTVYPRTGGWTDGAARAAFQTALAAVLGTVTVLFVRRLARWHGRLMRYANLAAVLPLAYVLFLLFDGQLLGGPLEVPLFAPMVWLILRLWRRMQQDGRTVVNAAADIVCALLLGGLVVLFLVWLANLLDVPVAEVRALRAGASHLGDLIDLPWWTWVSVDVLLSAVFLAAAVGDRRGRRITRFLGTIRLPGALEIVRRALSALKIALLTLVFLGLAGPPALDPVLSRHIRARYTADLRAELDARGRSALLQEISLRFARTPGALPVLTDMLIRVHDSAAPGTRDAGGDTEPTPAARDLAHRMGELQSLTLLPFFDLPSAGHSAPSAEPPTSGAVHDAGLDGTSAGSADLSARLTRAQDERRTAADSRHQADQAAEHAAAVVTGALGNLTFGHGEAIGLVRAYLDGLAESGLRNVFLSWAERLRSTSSADEPPDAQHLVEPEPDALRRAADAQLSGELSASGVRFGGDPAQDRADREAPLAAAVDLAEHTSRLQHGTDPCTGCVHYVEPGEHGGGHEEPRIHVE